jgi:quercetin dioxygenase-like cupin family protein
MRKPITAAILTLLATAAFGQADVRDKLVLTPDEIRYAAANPAVPAGLATAVIAGNPTRSGVYVMRIRLPANFKVPPHSHPDGWRTVTVVSGTLYFGYGEAFDESRMKALGPGSFFIEPKDEPHFGMTKGEEVVVQVTAEGPSGTNPVRGNPGR